MKMNIVIVLFSCVLAMPVLAQIPGIKESASFGETRSGNQDSGSPVVWHKTVENISSTPLVALEAVFNCPSSGAYSKMSYAFVHDSLENYGHDTDLPPGRSMQIDAMNTTKCPGGVEAVIFADGHSEGDPQIIADLYLRRHGIYSILAEIKTHFDHIAANTETPDQALNSLIDRDKSNGSNTAINISERKGMSYAIGVTKIILKSGSVLRVPSATPEEKPLRIDAVMAEQGVSRQQAQAIIMSNEIDQWRSALKPHLDPQTLAQ